MLLLGRISTTETKSPRPATQKHCLVSLPVLLVGDSIDDRIDACTQIYQQVAHDVQFWTLDVLVRNLDDSDGQIAQQKGTEDDENHTSHSPFFFASFCFSVFALGAGFGR